jgi:hypothetical protein
MRLSTLAVSAVLASSLIAQETVTVTTGPGNATQTFYSFQNGVVESRPLAEWDLAFEITGFTASILVNTAKGMEAYKAPYAVSEWMDVDTMGMGSSWTRVHNSDTSWSHGAFNQGLTENEFDLGWGVYNIVTHQVAGDSIFVLKLANNDWKKLRIDGLSANTYTFTWSDLDGANEQTGTLPKASYTGKNFGYYSLENNTAIDREPPTTDWDAVFTKYVAMIPTAYPVTGVLINKERPALRVEGVTPDQAGWQDGPYTNWINTIGYDWKTFNMQTFQYEYNEELTFFVTDAASNVWKIYFTEFGGATTGDITFVQELVSATSVETNTGAELFTMFPNPASGGQVQILAADGGQLSIHDMSGRVVAQQQLQSVTSPAVRTVDIAALSAGIYVVRFQMEGISFSRPLVIE